MSVRLSVFNIPPALPFNQFKAQFEKLKGFKTASYVYNYQNQPVGGIIEFVSVELADYAKKIMQNFKFPNSNTGIVIDFMREDNQDLQKTAQNMSQPQNPPFIYQQYGQAFSTAGRAPGTPQLHTGLLQPQGANPGTNPGMVLNQAQYLATPGQLLGANPQVLTYAVPSQQNPQGDPNSVLGIYGNAALNPALNTQQFKDSSNKIFEIPSDATNCLYVDGIPIDASDREVARILYFNN